MSDRGEETAEPVGAAELEALRRQLASFAARTAQGLGDVDGDDLLQEALLIYIKERGAIKGSATAYLRKVIVHLAYDLLKKQRHTSWDALVERDGSRSEAVERDLAEEREANSAERVEEAVQRAEALLARRGERLRGLLDRVGPEIPNDDDEVDYFAVLLLRGRDVLYRKLLAFRREHLRKDRSVVWLDLNANAVTLLPWRDPERLRTLKYEGGAPLRRAWVVTREMLDEHGARHEPKGARVAEALSPLVPGGLSADAWCQWHRRARQRADALVRTSEERRALDVATRQRARRSR